MQIVNFKLSLNIPTRGHSALISSSLIVNRVRKGGGDKMSVLKMAAESERTFAYICGKYRNDGVPATSLSFLQAHNYDVAKMAAAQILGKGATCDQGSRSHAQTCFRINMGASSRSDLINVCPLLAGEGRGNRGSQNPPRLRPLKYRRP